MKRLTFEKSKRLLSNRQFSAVLSKRLRAGDDLLTVYVAGNDRDGSRLGVSVSRACGNAVVRNRLKRLIREAFRRNDSRIAGGFDYVVMVSRRWSKVLNEPSAPKRAAAKLRLDRVQASLLALVEKGVALAGRAKGQPPS